MIKTTVAASAIVLAGLLPGAGLWLAGNAHADINEDAFVSALATQKIYPVTTVEALITGGHQVCSERSQGISELAVAVDVWNRTDLSRYQAGFFVGAAEAAFCPKYYDDGSMSA